MSDLREAFIKLRQCEIQSGMDRVKWAEGLIRQLPENHDGRNSWLLNYAGEKHETDKVVAQPEAVEPVIGGTGLCGHAVMAAICERCNPPLAPDERMRRALEEIASFNDTRANNVLAVTGSYGSFDEPGAVKIAREALSRADEGKESEGGLPPIDEAMHTPEVIASLQHRAMEIESPSGPTPADIATAFNTIPPEQYMRSTPPDATAQREAVALALAEKWPGDYMQGDDEDEREPNALAYETADVAVIALQTRAGG